MQIIPVIDVLGGQVVRAVAGNRADYLPIRSFITQSTTPSGVLEDLLKFYDFKTIYIAELDAIQYGQLNSEFYLTLFKLFPKVSFWFDFGVTNKADLKVFSELENVQVVVGTETLIEPDVLLEANIVLSLDYRNGAPLGLEQLHQQAEYWPKQVIVMSLDQVGQQSGPNYELMKEVSSKNNNCGYFAAGGVKDVQDLALLANKGITGVLLASALHNGSIDKEVLKQFQ